MVLAITCKRVKLDSYLTLLWDNWLSHAKEWDSYLIPHTKINSKWTNSGNANGVAAVEIRMVVPQKQTNIELPSDPPLGISKRTESKNSNRCWYTSIHRGIIHNGQKMETGLFCLLHEAKR